MISFASVRIWAPAPMARRSQPRHDLDLKRGIPVLFFGLLGLFVIVAMAIGYIQGGDRAPLGVARQLSTGHLVEMDSRMLAGGRYQLVSVTPAGALQGFRPTQIIDMTNWNLVEKLDFAYPTPTSLAEGAALREHQGLQAEVWAAAGSARGRGKFIQHGLDILVRLVLLISALCILQFANGRPALWAGLYLGFVAMADSPTATFAGLPENMQIAGLSVATLARPAAYITRIAFVMSLFPGSSGLKQVCLTGFTALLTVLSVFRGGQLATILFNAPIISVSPLLLPILQCITQLATLAIFFVAAWKADAKSRFVLRIIFVSTFITLFSYIIQEFYLILGIAPPGWMFWYFNAALLGAGIGYPWAIFARRIAGVDFIISRGVAYAVSVAFIFCVIEIAGHVLDNLFDGWRANELLIYGIPIAVTLSMSWFQDKMTMLVGFVLDGDLRHLERTLLCLRESLPSLPDIKALSDAVTHHVAAALHMENATLYARYEDGNFRSLSRPQILLPIDDPATQQVEDGEPIELDEMESRLQAGLLFPLIVFGQLVGFLHCGARPHGKGYDRMERHLLKELARDVAVAVVWLDPHWRASSSPGEISP